MRWVTLLLFSASVALFGVHDARSQVDLREAFEVIDPILSVTMVREEPRVVMGTDVCAERTAPWGCPSPSQPTHVGSGLVIGVGASGDTYHLNVGNGYVVFDPYHQGFLIQRTTPGGLTHDMLRYRFDNYYLGNYTRDRQYIPTGFALDATSGRIIIALTGDDIDTTTQPPTRTDRKVGVVAITGLPTLFDTLLTFIPGQQAMNILTPAHPDGFRSADAMQVWTGDVRSMPDWSQAEPLTCEAAANPIPGQMVSVSDTLPDPPMGQGRYYLVASQSGADRRLGRQYVNGAFSARQPAGLPACDTP